MGNGSEQSNAGSGRPWDTPLSGFDAGSIPTDFFDEHVPKRRRDSTGTMFSATDDGDRPLAVTCNPCRTKKIKCDSQKPVCNNCSRNPNDCYYPVKQKPGLRRGTGTDMMKRIEKLEARVQQQEARLADQESRLNSVSPPTGLGNNNPAPVQTMSSNNQLLGFAGIDLTTPSTSSRPLIEMPPPPLPNTSSLDFLDFSNTNASPSGLSTASFADPHVLPAAEIVNDLVTLFWRHIHPWAPFLSPTQLSFTQPWNIIVHAIVVLTIRLSDDPRLEGNKEQIKRAAKQQVLSHAIESTSLESVQALALLGLDLIGTDLGPSSWGILALLTRSAVHLGLTAEDNGTGNNVMNRGIGPISSRTSIIPPAANWQEDESRRRLFWLIFALDRYACASTGWEFALPDFDIKRRLPCSRKLWAGQTWYITPEFRPIPHLLTPHDPGTLSPLAYLVEVLDLSGRAQTLQSQEIDPGDSRAVERRRDSSVTITSAAKRWFGDLPIRNEVQNGMTLMIQAIYHATLLKLNAYYAYPALSTGDPVEPHTSTCLSSAKAMADLTNIARDTGWMSSSTPLFIWSCWVAARVLFVHAFLSHHNTLDPGFDIIVNALREQAKYWTLANQYVKLLERAKRKWLESSIEPNPSLPDAIHVLLDLRRTAYSAVAGTTDATPNVTPPDLNLSHLPAWAVQPLLGDLHSWFDLPAGTFQNDM